MPLFKVLIYKYYYFLSLFNNLVKPCFGAVFFALHHTGLNTFKNHPPNNSKRFNQPKNILKILILI